jgi:chorismate-pyruvate lyase
MTHFSSKFTV